MKVTQEERGNGGETDTADVIIEEDIQKVIIVNSY
mgnify:CR=1 FL=1